MTPLYTQVEFNAAKSRDKLPLKCESCDATFYRPKNDIQTGMKDASRDRHCYCSLRCSAQYKGGSPQITVSCDQCGKPFKKLPNQIKKYKHNFCSQSCACKYNNANKTTGTRVSRFERWLQEQLPVLFPSLEFHFNRKDAINGELDIYIPSLKLAFELNGIFHYEPIYGPEKLGRIQNNDERKMQACIEHGIELCIVDVSSSKYFKPAKVEKFLDIIFNLIHSKLLGT